MKIVLSDNTELNVTNINESIFNDNSQLMITVVDTVDVEGINASIKGKTDPIVVKRNDIEIATFTGYNGIQNISRDINEYNDNLRITLIKE